MEDLPNECIEHIGLLGTAQEVFILSELNKRFHKIFKAKREQLYKNKALTWFSKIRASRDDAGILSKEKNWNVIKYVFRNLNHYIDNIVEDEVLGVGDYPYKRYILSKAGIFYKALQYNDIDFAKEMFQKHAHLQDKNSKLSMLCDLRLTKLYKIEGAQVLEWGLPLTKYRSYILAAMIKTKDCDSLYKFYTLLDPEIKDFEEMLKRKMITIGKLYWHKCYNNGNEECSWDIQPVRFPLDIIARYCTYEEFLYFWNHSKSCIYECDIKFLVIFLRIDILDFLVDNCPPERWYKVVNSMKKAICLHIGKAHPKYFEKCFTWMCQKFS